MHSCAKFYQKFGIIEAMKTRFAFTLLLVSAFFGSNPITMDAQTLPNPAEKPLEWEYEHQEDPYRPNAYGNQRTTPPYRFVGGSTNKVSASSIFTHQANVDPSGNNVVGDAANEPSIAVNPLNPDQIAIGWRQFDDVSSNFRQAGWNRTTDGGQTWGFISVIDPGLFRSDPVLDYDLAGNFYYNSLTNTPNYFCKTFASTDGGTSWDAGTDAGGGDKQWIAIDRTSGIGTGNIYSFWSEFFTTCTPGFFTRSTNGNNSYESCTYVDGSPWRGTMAVSSNGNLYIGAMSSIVQDSVVFSKSTNAETPGSTIAWTSRMVFMDGKLLLGLPINPAGLTGQINLETDLSGGGFDGNIYMMGPMTRFSNSDPCDVMFVRSTDEGTTWSAPIKVNDDISTTNNQWMATMAVAPNGRIDAAWLDTRDAPGSDSSALYYAYSLDAGFTWSANEKLSDLFDPHVGYPNQDKLGDYFDMVSTNSGAHLAWAGTLNGEEDVYYSYIQPGVIAGVQAETMGMEFAIYPNPTDGQLILEVAEGITELVILNPIDNIVHQQQLRKGATELDLRTLPAGIYLLRITAANGTSSTKRMVKL
jgi:hypothetical protein